jgi:hypothetical protein
MPARISAFTSATCVFGCFSAQLFFTPNTFSGLFFQISRSVMIGTPTPFAIAC